MPSLASATSGNERERVFEEISLPHASVPLTLAVAYDEAFCFYYRENLELFESLGIEIEYFSPMHDHKLPDNAAGLLLGGGYPELHLKTLASNGQMLEAIRDAIGDGMPSLAECGGFMYLHDEIESMEGAGYKMAGVIRGSCRYTGHLANFGYVSIEDAAGDGADDFCGSLTGLRGHEFHYYESTAKAEDLDLLKPSSGRRYRGMIAGSNRLWGFPHFYYPSNPAIVGAFAERMKRYAKRHNLLRE